MPGQLESIDTRVLPPVLDGQRVLLITDRPFVNPTDGSTHTYLMWLRVLTELGCQVSVLSFDRRRVRWSPGDRAKLEALTVSSLIVEAHASRSAALLHEAMSTGWRCLAGRRYLPIPVEAVLRRNHRDQVAAFLRQGNFHSIVLNKLYTTTLIGRPVFQSISARKVIDMHDNFPMREVLNRRILLDLARTDRRAFRAALQPRELLEMLGWGGQNRKLAEEVALLAGFDHVVFNAREEAAIYAGAGLPRAKITVLPLPRPAELKANTVPGQRAFQVGLIASAALSNVEGLRFLMREIMPALHARGVRLLVAGTIGRAAKPLLQPGDEALGWIDDVSDFYDQVEVVLVPLLTGTGVSVKTMEAASRGAAIVTTVVGMRGLDLEPGRDLLVADDAQEFIACVLRVLDDAALRADLRRNAAEGLVRHHAREIFKDGVVRLLAPSAGLP